MACFPENSEEHYIIRPLIMDYSEPQLDGYELVRMLGGGATGIVYLAIRQSDRKPCCVKCMKKKDVPNIAREINNFRKCEHSRIIKLYDIIENETEVYIVMEYASGGSLASFIMKGPFADRLAYKFFIQILSAVDYLHTEHHLMHRDLKPENVMLDEHMNVKLIDFGFSKETTGSPQCATACGSPAFVAPEVIKREEYSYSADIWSVGIILYVMVVGKLPFNDPNLTSLLRLIVEEELTFPEEPNVDPVLKDLLIRLLDKNPLTRITIPEIYQHPWMTNLAKMVMSDIPKVGTVHSFHSRPNVRVATIPRKHSNTQGAVTPAPVSNLPCLANADRRRVFPVNSWSAALMKGMVPMAMRCAAGILEKKALPKHKSFGPWHKPKGGEE